MEPQPLQSRIARVEVYRSRALVTRSALWQPPPEAGRAELVIAGLPPGLQADSIRLELDPAAARVVDVELGWVAIDRQAPQRSRAQRDWLALERERIELAVDREREAARLSLLESLRPRAPAGTELPEALAFAERRQTGAHLELAAWAGEALIAGRDRLRRIERRQRELADRQAAALDGLEREALHRQQSLAALQRQAKIALAWEASGERLELRLSYLIAGARWLPEYELRVPPSGESAELVVRALVAQQTGEPWPRTAMALSTADLARSCALPELQSWRIGKRQPPPATGWRPLPEGLDALFAGYDRDRRPAAVEAPAAAAPPELPAAPRLGPAPQPAPQPQPVAESTPAGAAAPRDELDAEAPPGAPEELLRAAAEPEEALLECTASAPPPAPLAVAPEAASKQRSRRSAPPAGGGAVAAVPEPEPAAEPGLDASRRALDFDRLRMRGPEAGAARGRLEAAGPAERLAERAAGDLDGLLDEVPDAAWRSLLEPAPPPAAPPADHGAPLDRAAGHFAVRYPVEAPAAVADDGGWHGVTVLRRRGSGRRIYRCVPLLDDSVYQLVAFDNPLELALLAGPVRVYRGGDFVVSAPLATTGPGEPLLVNLGVEPGIAVARNTSHRESSEGLFGGATALIQRVAIEARSRLAQPVTLELFERLPVSDDPEVTIEQLAATPEPQPYRQTDRGRPIRGGLRFRLPLQPDRPAHCTLEYRINISSKRVLVGGNRRD
jgi:hypothetical protein